jgi:hypothetical protein
MLGVEMVVVVVMVATVPQAKLALMDTELLKIMMDKMVEMEVLVVMEVLQPAVLMVEREDLYK